VLRPLGYVAAMTVVILNAWGYPYWDPRLQIGDRTVVGVWADDLEVWRVRVLSRSVRQ